MIFLVDKKNSFHLQISRNKIARLNFYKIDMKNTLNRITILSSYQFVLTNSTYIIEKPQLI